MDFVDNNFVPSERKNTFGSVFKFLIQNILGVTTALTLVGFYVINSYLYKVAPNFFTYNIPIVEYLAAGTNLILAVFWNVLLPMIVLAILTVIVLAVFGWFWKKLVPQGHFLQTAERIPLLKSAFHIPPVLRDMFFKIWEYASWLVIFVFIVLVGFIYGPFYYSDSPRVFGGGMPADITLLFKDGSQSDWPFTVISSIGGTLTPSKRSEKVKFLIELSDSILVQYGENVVEVKNDALSGVIYPQPTASIRPSLTLTLNPSPTP